LSESINYIKEGKGEFFDRFGIDKSKKCILKIIVVEKNKLLEGKEY